MSAGLKNVRTVTNHVHVNKKLQTVFMYYLKFVQTFQKQGLVMGLNVQHTQSSFFLH